MEITFTLDAKPGENKTLNSYSLKNAGVSCSEEIIDSYLRNQGQFFRHRSGVIGNIQSNVVSFSQAVDASQNLEQIEVVDLTLGYLKKFSKNGYKTLHIDLHSCLGFESIAALEYYLSQSILATTFWKQETSTKLLELKTLLDVGAMGVDFLLTLEKINIRKNGTSAHSLLFNGRFNYDNVDNQFDY